MERIRDAHVAEVISVGNQKVGNFRSQVPQQKKVASAIRIPVLCKVGRHYSVTKTCEEGG